MQAEILQSTEMESRPGFPPAHPCSEHSNFQFSKVKKLPEHRELISLIQTLQMLLWAIRMEQIQEMKLEGMM